MSVLSRLKRAGVDVNNHLELEYAVLAKSNRPRAWVNGNPNQHGVDFPTSCRLRERDYLACYCNKKGTCVACVADWDFGCKYAMRLVDSGKWDEAT
jgi:hypothetical protein